MSTTEHKHVNLREVESVEIISIVDNTVDFLSSNNKKEVQSFRQWTQKLYGQKWTKTYSQLPVAEHGFSMLIRVLNKGESHSILFDTGSSPNGVVENSARMGLDLKEVECIVLSHGHYDHWGGLLFALKAIAKVNLPVIAHKDMFKTRGTTNQNGTIRKYPEFPSQEQLRQANLIETKQPFAVADGTVLVTGEIPRETSFEKGYSQHRVLKEGAWKPDPWIIDDRAIVFNVKEKGIVVLSGCAHAGIINTVTYARRITGVAEVHAVMGGFHLAGKENENRIDSTISELKRLNPKLVAPSHCTGWKAMCAIAEALPDAFVWNSVGNLYEV